MAAQGRKSSTNQPSIKYMRIPLEFASFELANVRKEEDARTRSDFQPEHSEHSAPKSSKNMLSTSEFMSAVGGIWNSLNQPYAIFQSKPNVKENDVYETENVICFSDDAINIEASNCYTEYFRTGSKSRFFTHKVNSNLEHLKAIQRMSVLEPCSRHDSNISSLWRYTWAANSDAHLESERTDGLDSVGVCYDLGRIYGCIFANPFNGLKDLVKFTQIECTKPAETAASENKTPPADITLYGNMDCKSNDLPNLTKCKDCGVENAEPIENMQQPVSPLSTSYLLEPVANVDAYAISRAPCSGLYSDYHIKVLASSYCTVVESLEESSVSEDKDTCGDDGRQFKELVPEDDPPTELSLSMQNKPTNVVAKQRHAIAGAFAGTFVSLCLHPVDTIKTVIQARSLDQNSIGRVFGSIVSERGITGLYRGIASNIASSAPISAVYTFTYESVKGAMLPLLPKEYHSFAHCTAGGCASIATSFIFTPSERIKQQMQVGSHYQNCWTALVGILERGGLASLYAGWGAVLCRNIPHSIIKFYTYESLKQWMLSSQQSNAHPNTLQTLVCGGVAASTAALFTTPFDVVKTRLQTQIPGSLKHYDGVLHALQEIAKREGLKGLYRGLTPRLAMYMSQGAIFFASYEFFKRVFSFELPKLPARIIKDGQNVEDHSTSSRLHGLHS